MEHLCEMLRHEFKIRQRCRVISETSHASDGMLYLLLSFVPLVGIGLFVLGIVSFFVCFAEGEHILSCLRLMVFCFVLAFFVCWLGWISVSDACAEYSVSADGIRVKYPLQQEIAFSWDSFQEVCVCYVSRTSTIPARANSAICFIQHGETRDMYGRWKTDAHFHFRRTTAVDYSEELLELVRRYCPYPVLDHRGKGNYRL